MHNLFNNLSILNDGSPTHYDISTGLYSHLDISACSDIISHKFQWKTHHDKLSSDHFPIFIEYNLQELYTTKSARWNFGKANWAEYKKEIKIPDQYHDTNAGNSKIIDKIVNILTKMHLESFML